MSWWKKFLGMVTLGIVVSISSVKAQDLPQFAPTPEEMKAEAGLLQIELGLLTEIYKQKQWQQFRENHNFGRSPDRYSYVIYQNNVYFVLIRSNPFVMMGRAPTLEMIESFNKTRIRTSLLPEADGETFQMLEFGYAKDKKQVYYRGVPIENADSKSFQILNSKYAKDKSQVYSAHLPTWVYNQVDQINRIEFPIRAVKKADTQTFSLLFDKPDEIEDIYLSQYAKDEKYVYFAGERIEQSDSTTFMLFPESSYSKDKRQVYFNGQVLEGVKSQSFQVLSPFYDYGKDRNRVYRFGQLIEGADSETFEALDWRFSRDKNAVYNEGKKMDGLDSASFESIHVGSSPYSYKDKNGVYYGGDGAEQKVAGANPVTFILLKNSYEQEGPYGKDDKRVYFWEKVVKGADPNTFVMLPDTNYGIDKSSMYYGHSWSEVDKQRGWESNFLSHQVPMLFAEKRYDLVVKYLTKLLTLKRERWLHEDDILVRRGEAYFMLGEYDLALVDYDKVIQIQSKQGYQDHQFAAAYLGRGKVYFELKEYEKAIADGEMAKYHDPYNFEVCELLANTYVALGDKQAAIKEYEELLTRIIKNGIDPNSSSFKGHKSKIERKIIELGK